jgi:hypothetical protein
MPKLFISYRTADGKDKATALARDLGAVFGDAQVFLDKDDLRGGIRWSDEIARTIETRPVLLLLLTPQLLAATDDRGRLRIADPDDPIRREVTAALAAGAQLVPLLCDGLETPPPAAELPAPFNRIGDFSWLPLRAYDWQHDVQRLVSDLRALGVVPARRLRRQSPHRPPATVAAAGRGWHRCWLRQSCSRWRAAGTPGVRQSRRPRPPRLPRTSQRPGWQRWRPTSRSPSGYGKQAASWHSAVGR